VWYRFILILPDYDKEFLNSDLPWEWFLDSEEGEVHNGHWIYHVHRKIVGIGNREIYDRVRTHHDMVLVTKDEIKGGNIRFYWGFEPLAWPPEGLNLYRGAWLTSVE
jgi:hypothetical protein